MASEEQKIESRKICKEFLTLNKKLGLYQGSVNQFFNSAERNKMMKHGITSGFGSKEPLMSIEEAKSKLTGDESY